MAFFDFIKTTQATITKVLRFGPNSKITVQGEDRAEYDIDLNELRNVLDNSSSVQTLAAAKTLTAADSGKTFFLGLAGGFTVTLPLPAAGLEFEFKVSVAPTTAYIIATNGGANIMIGSVSCSTADDLGASDANADVLNFVASQAIVGDWVHFKSDGTSWYFKGNSFVAEGITTATT